MNDKEYSEWLYQYLQEGWSRLSKEEQESVERYYKLLYDTQGLPAEQQQEIIDNVTDENILKYLEEKKKSLS